MIEAVAVTVLLASIQMQKEALASTVRLESIQMYVGAQNVQIVGLESIQATLVQPQEKRAVPVWLESIQVQLAQPQRARAFPVLLASIRTQLGLRSAPTALKHIITGDWGTLDVHGVAGIGTLSQQAALGQTVVLSLMQVIQGISGLPKLVWFCLKVKVIRPPEGAAVAVLVRIQLLQLIVGVPRSSCIKSYQGTASHIFFQCQQT